MRKLPNPPTYLVRVDFDYRKVLDLQSSFPGQTKALFESLYDKNDNRTLVNGFGGHRAVRKSRSR